MSTATAPVLARLSDIRVVLRLDAVASGAIGVLLLAFGWTLDEVLGTPLALSVPAGVFLLVWATALIVLSSRTTVSRGAVREVVVVNALWAVGSVVLVLAGWFDLTALGTGFLLVQAAAVTTFAALQLRAS
jgi:hypothetical protein